MQANSCGCIYDVTDVDRETMEEEHPEIFYKGPTEEMYEQFDAVVEKAGGRLPWTGEYPGDVACREFGFWCYWQEGKGFIQCDGSHPGAREDLNRLAVSARWDAAARCWTWRGKSSP